MATDMHRALTAESAQPQFTLQPRTTQEPRGLIDIPIGLTYNVREKSVAVLNQVLADTIMLRDLYKKCHWQVAGPQFYQLHLLFDKHYTEQSELVDVIAERIQILGGLAAGMPQEVSDRTQLPMPESGREDVATQITHLAEAHRRICVSCRELSSQISDLGDLGTEDLLVSQVLRTNEMQAWFVAQHLSPATDVKIHADNGR